MVIEFRDTCVITRDNGGKDEWDNPIDPEIIYSGKCLYEEGGKTAMYVRSGKFRICIRHSVAQKTRTGHSIYNILYPDK